MNSCSKFSSKLVHHCFREVAVLSGYVFLSCILCILHVFAKTALL